MGKEQKQFEHRSRKTSGSDLKYRQVEIAAIKGGRHGKHHDLVEGILRELGTVLAGSAIKIPLADVGGVGLANLRSAVRRASTTKKIAIETRADESHLYVWNATPSE